MVERRVLAKSGPVEKWSSNTKYKPSKKDLLKAKIMLRLALLEKLSYYNKTMQEHIEILGKEVFDAGDLTKAVRELGKDNVDTLMEEYNDMYLKKNHLLKELNLKRPKEIREAMAEYTNKNIDPSHHLYLYDAMYRDKVATLEEKLRRAEVKLREHEMTL